MSGRSPSKTASTTTPVISWIRPVLVPSSPSAPFASFSLSVAASTPTPFQAVRLSCRRSRQSLGPGDDFHDLLGDLGLALAVHLERQIVDHLTGVLLSAAHGGHARAVLGCGRLEQRPEDRDLDVVGDEALEDLLRLRLVEPERALLIGPGGLIGACVVLVLALLLRRGHELGHLLE